MKRMSRQEAGVRNLKAFVMRCSGMTYGEIGVAIGSAVLPGASITRSRAMDLCRMGKRRIQRIVWQEDGLTFDEAKAIDDGVLGQRAERFIEVHSMDAN